MALAAIMLGGAFINKAEAVQHFHNWNSQGKEEYILLCDSNLYNEGLIKSVHNLNEDSWLHYYGTWKRQTDGSILVKYERRMIKDSQARPSYDQYTDLEFKIRFNKNQLQVVDQEAPSALLRTPYGLHEYVWGNDKDLCNFMLEKYLVALGKSAFVVNPIAPMTDALAPEYQKHIRAMEQGATDAGVWFEASLQGVVKDIYYVEADPCRIYRKVGNRLEQVHQLGMYLDYLERGGAVGNLGNNRGRVVMFKERSNEYYDIYFAPDHFIVERATADDAAVAASLQAEVGVRQEYGPNPRVREAKEKLGL